MTATRSITTATDENTGAFDIRCPSCPFRFKACLSGLERPGWQFLATRCKYVATDTLNADALTIGCNYVDERAKVAAP